VCVMQQLEPSSVFTVYMKYIYNNRDNLQVVERRRGRRAERESAAIGQAEDEI